MAALLKSISALSVASATTNLPPEVLDWLRRLTLFGVGFKLGRGTERARLKKKALVSRRLLTPYLLNHADCESFVSAGGLRGIVGDLPEWCKRPEFETVLWLNGVITTLWPHLSAALSQKIGTALGKIVGKISPLGISLSFREFALGNESLNVLSVRKASSNFTSSKTTTSGDDEVVLDLDVRWCGDPTVVLDVRVMGLTLQVRLQELQLVGPLRLVLGGFDDRMPCFHLMKIAFVEQPLVDFSLSLVGGDIEMFPGVKESITEIIAKGLAKAIVWPKYVKVPIANKNGKAGVSQGDARAVLEVTLVKGNNLRNVRAFGKSDPFVTSKVTGSSRTVKKSSVVVGSRNPRWNETFKLIIDDPTTQTVSINVSDYSPFAEDAGVRQLGKTLLKINGACFGWQRVMRRRVYNIGGVRKTYKKGAKLERAVTTGADTDDSDFSLFQTTMGTGRVSLKNLVPFQETAHRVILTKSAYSIINDSGLGLGSNDPRSKRKANAAGTLDVRLRLVPLSADVTRTARALATTGAAATRALNEHRASLGVVDKKTFVKRMLEKHDKRETEADRVARAKKAEQKKKADDVEVLVRGVLGGEADKILDSGQNEIATATPSVDFHRLRPHLYGLLHVTLVRGEGLVPKDTSGLSDPYFELSLNAQKWRSQTARQTLNPTFDACFEFFVTPDDFLTPGVSLNLECWDEDIVGKDFMGDARIVLRNVVRKSLTALGETVFERVALGGVESGAAHFKFRFQPADVSAFRALSQRDGGDGTVEGWSWGRQTEGGSSAGITKQASRHERHGVESATEGNETPSLDSDTPKKKRNSFWKRRRKKAAANAFDPEPPSPTFSGNSKGLKKLETTELGVETRSSRGLSTGRSGGGCFGGCFGKRRNSIPQKTTAAKRAGHKDESAESEAGSSGPDDEYQIHPDDRTER